MLNMLILETDFLDTELRQADIFNNSLENVV